MISSIEENNNIPDSVTKSDTTSTKSAFVDINICDVNCNVKCDCNESNKPTKSAKLQEKTSKIYSPLKTLWNKIISVIYAAFSWTLLILEVLLCNVVMLLALPFFTVGMLVLSIYRVFLSLYLRHKYNGKVFLMKGQDSFWALDEYANSCNFYAIHTYQGECNLENIQERLNNGCVNKILNGDFVYDRLKRKIVTKGGFHCWEHMEDSFDIRNHVKYITGDATAIFTEDDVFAEIQKKFDHPIEDTRPQWEVLVVPRFIYKDPILSQMNHYACIYRINHAFTDGISSGNAIQHAISDSPVKLTIDPLTFPELPLLKKIFAHVAVIILGPRAFFKALFLSEENCFHGLELTGPKTLGWSLPINIEALKHIKNQTHTSVTSVLISALGGSVRNLALKKNLPVPKVIHAVPTIAMLPYPSIKPQNRFSLALLPIATGLTTCRERLLAAHQANRNLSRSPDILMNFYMMSLMGLCPKWILRFIFTLTHATMLLSNIPGPAEMSTFLGHPFVDIAVWSPLKNRMGIGMALFSYNGRVRCSIVADKSALNDASDVVSLILGFQDEILTLADMAQVPPTIQVFQ